MACDVERLKRGFTLDEEIQVNESEIYDPPEMCMKYENQRVRVLKSKGEVQLNVKYFTKIDLPNGIFTYIFTPDETFLASPMENLLEIGSKHKFLAFKAKTRTALSAGELIKIDGKIQFNLFSGTFMQEFMINTLQNKCSNEMIERTKQLFQKSFPTLQIENTTTAFNKESIIPLKKEHLLKYVSAGYEVRIYQNVQACNPLAKVRLTSRLQVLERSPKTEANLKEIATINENLKSIDQFIVFRKRDRGGRKTKRKRRYSLKKY